MDHPCLAVLDSKQSLVPEEDNPQILPIVSYANERSLLGPLTEVFIVSCAETKPIAGFCSTDSVESDL
jgi:hypothetical protein